VLRSNMTAATTEGPNPHTPRGTWLLVTASVWMGGAFLVAFVLAAIVLAVFGFGDRGTELALRVTARWCFILFWAAYAGSAIAWASGRRFNGLADRGRALGLAFASALLVHVGLVIWLYHIATGPIGAMVFFWMGVVCTFLIALFSLPRLRNAVAPIVWRLGRTVALEYIALVFTADFILAPIQAAGLSKFPPTYVPLGLMLVGGAALRIVAFADRKLRDLREAFPVGARGSNSVSRFCQMLRENWQMVGLLLLLLSAGLISSALNGTFGTLYESAVALYGPSVVVFVAYGLFKSRLLV
jgi:hypothetical protein